MNNDKKLSIEEINRMLLFQEEDFRDLHQAVKNDSLILFIGAGVSKLYGCLLWNEMATALIEGLLKEKLITYAERDILHKEVDENPRKVISICCSICEDKNKVNVYEDAISNTVTQINDAKIKEIYYRIFSINPIAILTTNIDLGIKKYISNHIQSIYNKPTIYNCTSPYDQKRIEQTSYNVFKDRNTFYLHGNCENISECILPVDKYLTYYSESNKFINGLFSAIKDKKSVIIFIGYGLNEWDIIERLYKIKNSPREIVAYLLSPIYSYEITKFSLERNYYKFFGVEPIPYIIDDEGYEKLYFVLDNLLKAIDKSRPSPYKILSEIEKVI